MLVVGGTLYSITIVPSPSHSARKTAKWWTSAWCGACLIWPTCRTRAAASLTWKFPTSTTRPVFLYFYRHGKTPLKEASRNVNPVVTNKLNLIKRLREVELTIPKFKLRSNLDMKAIIGKVGAHSVFSEQADLSRMTPSEEISLSAARHTGFFCE